MFKLINTFQEIPKGVIYLTVSVLYVSAIIIIRWNLIALPLRQNLRVAIDSLKARLHVAVFGNEKQTNADEQIGQLLKNAERQLDSGIWDKIFWSRGREMNGWRYVHAAGRLMSLLYPPEVVESRLRRALSELKDIPTHEASDLMKNIEVELKTERNGDIKLRRALLNGALATIYDVRDNRYNEMDTWDNESVWMITSGLLLIAALGQGVGNSTLFMVGAAGGFLGRLTHLYKVKFGSTDYGLYWDPLFMAPVLGALTGWTGVLIVSLIGKQGLGIVGAPITDFTWYGYPWYALALAFLFGLSERFFVKLVSEAQTKVVNIKATEGT